MIGQEKVKTICSTLLKYSIDKDVQIPHILFSGNSGNGKTSFATALATEKGTHLYSVNAASIRDKRALLKIIETIAYKDILFIDEIHALTKRAAESIYTIMEDYYYFDDYGKHIKTPKFTMIGASTEIGLLPAPFKQRFQYVAEFDPYTDEELIDICQLVCQKQGFKLNRDMAGIIARTCRGVPRLVKNRTMFIYQYMVANGIKKVDRTGLLKIIALQGADKDGLERLDYEYIKSLKNYVLGVDTISSKIGADSSTIKKDIEPFLIKKNYVTISKAGRSLTTQGMILCKKLMTT